MRGRRATKQRAVRRLRLERLEQRLVLNGTAPTLEFTEDNVYAHHLMGDTFEINFEASDPDSAATVNLFYDTDNNAANGNIPIASGLAATGGDQSYDWDLSNVEPGLYYIYGEATDGTNTTSAWADGALIVSSPAGNPLATFETSEGTFSVALSQFTNPITVANFRTYAQNGFYDGLIFHRVIPNFMVQGGGFTDTLVQRTTNPPILNENIVNPQGNLSNVRGTIAMARTNQPHSATSQFFVNVVDNQDRPPFIYNGEDQPGYVVFGAVIGGMEYVDEIRDVPTHYENPSFEYLPDAPVYINSVTITDAALPSDEIWVVIGDDNPRMVTFVDDDGTEGTVMQTGGTAQIKFTGEGLRPVFERGRIVIQGDADIAEVVLGETSSRSRLMVTARGGADGTVDIGQITGISHAGSFIGRGADLVGAGIAMEEDGIFSLVQVNSVADETDIIMPGAEDRGVVMMIGALGAGSDIALYNAGVRVLRADSWAGSSLQAEWASVVLISGDMGADVLLTGDDGQGTSLRTLSVRGALTGATVSMPGDCTVVMADSWIGGQLRANNVRVVRANGDIDADIDVNELQVLMTRGALGGRLEVDTDVRVVSAGSVAPGWKATVNGGINVLVVLGDAGDDTGDSVDVVADHATSVIIRGDLENANLEFMSEGAALNTLMVSGWARNTSVRSMGDINVAMFGGVDTGELYAGVADVLPTPMPTADDDFIRESSINRVLVRGIRNAAHSVLDYNIAAWNLGMVMLADPQTDNGGESFGVTYHTLQRLQVRLPDEIYRWPNREEPDAPSGEGDATIIPV